MFSPLELVIGAAVAIKTVLVFYWWLTGKGEISADGDVSGWGC